MDDAVDGCGILFLDSGLDGNARGVGEGKHLKDPPVESEEVFLDQRVSGPDIGIDSDAQVGADAVVTVKRDTVAIPCQDQEKVEEQLLWGEGIEKAILQKPVFDKGKGPLDGTHPLRGKDDFFSHGTPPG